ncbi:MAG: hypothetical protein V4722_28595 [Bacteroidota bacterium]
MKPKILLILLFLLVCCKEKAVDIEANPQKNSTKVRSRASATEGADLIKSTDYKFFSDSVFGGYEATLKYYLTRYHADSCKPLTYAKSELHSRGFVKLGSIHLDGKIDSVFVLPPLNYCSFRNEIYSGGMGYYFTDTTLPRLQTDSECCSPSCIFLVGDIDENGVSEIGQFYSSCVGHYKSLYVYSLKGNTWKEVGHSIFDIQMMDSKKPLRSFVRKTGRRKFEMLEITDLGQDRTKVGKPNWIQFKM